jgi:hypothetical protein
MQEWYAIFADSPNDEPELIKRSELRGPRFGEFAAAAVAGKIGNRAVTAMWVLDPKRDDATAIYGRLLVSVIEKVSGRTKRFPTKRSTKGRPRRR